MSRKIGRNKRTKPKYKLSRRIGYDLLGHKNTPVNRRGAGLVGERGVKGVSRRMSEYGTKLQSKQSLKNYYLLKEHQFSEIFSRASKKPGDKMLHVISSLESRLITVVYRMKLAPTMNAARQMVNHKHVYVDQKRVNVPTYRVKPGSLVSLSSRAKNFDVVAVSINRHDNVVPSYIEVNHEKCSGVYTRHPEDVSEVFYGFPLDLNSVIEYYSR